MKFEFDPAKSAVNKLKHGIDFIEAQKIWLDPSRIEGPARVVSGEPRDLVLGRIQQTLWAAIVTHRHEETIRIISVRRARREDERDYRQAEDDLG